MHFQYCQCFNFQLHAGMQTKIMYGYGKEIDNKLQEYNLTRTNTSPLIFDNTSKKYGLTVTYEVRYNGITNAFEFIK